MHNTVCTSLEWNSHYIEEAVSHILQLYKKHFKQTILKGSLYRLAWCRVRIKIWDGVAPKSYGRPLG